MCIAKVRFTLTLQSHGYAMQRRISPLPNIARPPKWFPKNVLRNFVEFVSLIYADGARNRATKNSQYV